MVKDTGSPCFDAAYFVLRSDMPATASEADMLTEASRVIDACSVAGFLSGDGHTSIKKARKYKNAAGVMMISAAAGLGLIAGAAAALICCYF